MVVDLLVLVLVALAMVAGYRRGVGVSLVAVAAFLVGASLGASAGTLVGGRAVAFGGLVGGLVATVPVSLRADAIRNRLHGAVASTVLHQVDHGIGAAFAGVFALCVAWFVGIVVALTPPKGTLHEAVAGSRIVTALTGVVTPTGAAATLVLRSGLVPAMDGPLIIAEDPDDAVVASAAVRVAARSVVHVTGRACEVIASGSGWVISPRFVVTNAHVVAGVRSPTVEVRPPGTHGSAPVRAYDAYVVAFDPGNDVAVLIVPGLALAPMRMSAAPVHGQPAAIIGFPRRDGLTFSAARYDRTVEYPMTDIYDEPAGDVRVAVFRGDVRPGNSGGPVVDADGAVIATVTAAALEQRLSGGFAVPNDVVREVMATALHRVSTGPCMEEDRAAAAPR